MCHNSDIPNLTEEEARMCDGKSTLEECYRSLQLFENDKSRGDDVLAVES